MAGAAEQTVRVVAVRGGRCRVAEFALRRGESGLSMFACETEQEVRRVVEAVRAAGKKGELAAAALTEHDLEALGLERVPLPGGTPDERVNELHVEVRLSVSTAETARRLSQEPWEFFNQQMSGAIHARARIIFEG